jgi:hypothetical protein
MVLKVDIQSPHVRRRKQSLPYQRDITVQRKVHIFHQCGGECIFFTSAEESAQFFTTAEESAHFFHQCVGEGTGFH